MSDPGQRIHQIAAETARRKEEPPSLGALFRSRIARRALLKALDRQPVNVTSADLPRPPQPVYLAGARLLKVFPVPPLISRVSVAVGALSYAGQFNIMAVADRGSCPDLDVSPPAPETRCSNLRQHALPDPESLPGEQSPASRRQRLARTSGPDRSATRDFYLEQLVAIVKR